MVLMGLLVRDGEADFNTLKQQAGLSAGNLSIQLAKLRQAGCIEVSRRLKGGYSLTTARMTPSGRQSFAEFLRVVRSYEALLEQGQTLP